MISACLMGCVVPQTFHSVRFRDPAAVSVLLHPPGPKTGQLSLADSSRGAGEAVSFADPAEAQPAWTLRGLRGDYGAVDLEFRVGDSLLSGFPLIDSAGVLDGRVVIAHGVHTSGDLTLVRDPDGLVWARLGYVPTAPSARQEGQPDWRRVAARMEEGGPAAISLVTTAANIHSMNRRSEVSWEAPTLLLVIGAFMIATSIPLFIEAAEGDLRPISQAVVLSTATLAATLGLFGVGGGTAGLLARGYYEELTPEGLPVRRPKGIEQAP